MNANVYSTINDSIIFFNLAVLDVTLAPRYAIQRMSEEKKRELVSTILEVADLNLAEDNEELQIQAHFMKEHVDEFTGELFKIVRNYSTIITY